MADYLNTTVPNPFQCFFVTVASPASYCPASPIFNPADVADSRYLDAEIPQANLLRPFPQFDGGFSGLPLLGANSWYNSLQIRFQKRTSHYISFEGNYTLSKATDDSTSGRNAWIGNLQYDNPQVLDNLKAEHGISANDATHRLTTAFILDIPVGRGRWIGGNMNGILDGILGGWSLDSFPYLPERTTTGIFTSALRLTDGNQRPNMICSKFTTGLSSRKPPERGGLLKPELVLRTPAIIFPGNAPRHFSQFAARVSATRHVAD